MAVPTVANIYPSTCHTGGEAMVRLMGGNFKVPVVGEGDTPTVEVLFGGNSSTLVAVVNHGLLYALVPAASTVDIKTGDASGPVDVTVRNLDSDGSVIPGETYTVTDGFTYRDVKLTGQSDLERLVRELIRQMRAQIVRNVVLSPHTDYDPSTGDGLNIVATAQVPSLALIGPSLKENRFFSRNTKEYVAAFGHKVQRRAPYTVDVSFRILGTANKTQQLVALQAATLRFFDRVQYLTMLRDPDDVTAGYVRYEMRMTQGDGLDVVLPGDEANLQSFTAGVTIKGFDMEILPGFTSVQDGASGIAAEVGGDDEDITVTIEPM